ncbi:MAG: hypothetical protein WC054_12980 [Candidatus Nanopelagicales bacterium]
MTTTPVIAPPKAAKADVIVIGARPEGSAAAYHHAQAGRDVLFPGCVEPHRGGRYTDRVIHPLTKVTPAA